MPLLGCLVVTRDHHEARLTASSALSSSFAIPELDGRHLGTGLVRLPPGEDVPLSKRVRRLIDTPAMRRLSQISQLGLVRLVYPGAAHTRFEHSLGVYRTALQFVASLETDQRFRERVSENEIERFLAAALLHDVGHWPYCHPIEDMRLEGITHHESLARDHITTGPLADALSEDWQLDPASVADTIAGIANTPGERIVRSMLSGPIDVDKIDYLGRDSLHAGVPYGRNFDQGRLMSSLTIAESGDALAITDKGKTAAELMVFARYVMFSEVYWHHAVRSATAMLQRGVFTLQDELDFALLAGASEQQFVESVLMAARGTPAEVLLGGIFGPERLLYKRLAQYNFDDSPEIYDRLARRPYAWLAQCATGLAEVLSRGAGTTIAGHEILIDAPPVKLEVQFDIDVYTRKTNSYRPLGKASPVVETLAREQFDKFVKRVRIYAHPRLASKLADLDLDAALLEVTS